MWFMLFTVMDIDEDTSIEVEAALIDAYPSAPILLEEQE